MRTGVVGLVGATVLATALAGCGSSSADQPAGKDRKSGVAVTLKLLQFMPTTLTVKVGTKVRWRNDEPITHTVTSGTYSGVSGGSALRAHEKPNGLFNFELAAKGDIGSYTFRRAGSYPYYCDIHKGMNAKVVVTK